MEKPDINNQNPFRVPENYFAGFPDKITQRINKNQPDTLSFNMMKPAIAAAILILALSVITLRIFVFNMVRVPPQPQVTEMAFIETDVDENTIVSEVIAGLPDNTERTDLTDQDNDEEMDYVAETVDYPTLLAEL